MSTRTPQCGWHTRCPAAARQQARGRRPEDCRQQERLWQREAAPDGRYAAGLTAYRQDIALAKGLPQPDDYLTHTVARDPNETFAFNFPDVNGTLISNEDPRFKGKVVLAIVTGTLVSQLPR